MQSHSVALQFKTVAINNSSNVEVYEAGTGSREITVIVAVLFPVCIANEPAVLYSTLMGWAA